MKARLLFAIGLLALLCLPAGPVLADNGPHMGYTPTTDACATCHRVQSPGGPALPTDPVPDCYTCHGSAATGADTNVQDGVYLERDGVTEAPGEGTPGRGLKGGGFTNALMDTNWDGAAVSAPTTSSHLVDGSTGTAWGIGAIGSGPGASINLSCISCHSPHATGTYRMLRTIPLNSGAAVGITVTDEVNKFYTVSDTNKKSGNQYFGEGYSAVGTAWGTMDLQESELSNWCMQCHTRYLAPTGSETTDSGDPIFGYRHMSQGAPSGPNDCLACHDWNLPVPPFLITTVGPMWNHYMECMTCHVAHGSSASMGGYTGNVAWPDGASTPSGDARSSLLRVDNQGTCQLCHGR